MNATLIVMINFYEYNSLITAHVHFLSELRHRKETISCILRQIFQALQKNIDKFHFHKSKIISDIIIAKDELRNSIFYNQKSSTALAFSLSVLSIFL